MSTKIIRLTKAGFVVKMNFFFGGGKMVGMRNVLIDEYDSIDLDLVWEKIHNRHRSAIFTHFTIYFRSDVTVG